MLHPKLHRPYTIREKARAMVFSDGFIWDLETTKVTDALKQIGNAVPPPMALAIAKKLQEVLQGRDVSRGSEGDEDVVKQESIAIDDQADQSLAMVKERLAGSETDDDVIDDLVIAQLENEFKRNTDDQTDAGREDEDEKDLDTDDGASDDGDINIGEDMKDQEDQEDPESEDENKQNWNTDEEMLSKIDDDPESEHGDEQNLDTDEEISNESEVEVDEDLEGQAGQENFVSEDESGQDLDADKKMAEESDVDSDEDMEDLDDLGCADEYDTNENMDSEEEFLVNTRIQREERINTGGSKDNAIVIDDSE